MPSPASQIRAALVFVWVVGWRVYNPVVIAASHHQPVSDVRGMTSSSAGTSFVAVPQLVGAGFSGVQLRAFVGLGHVPKKGGLARRSLAETA